MHAQQHGRDRRQRGTDHEGQGDDVVGVDTQQVGHLDVFGTGTAGAAQAGTGDEQGQAEHGDEGHHEHHDLHVGNQHFMCATWPDGEVARDQVGDGFVLGVLRQQNRVLQEDRHADGRDQRDQTVAAAQGAVGDPFDAVAVGTGNDDGRDEGRGHQERDTVESHHGQARDGDERHIGTDHVHLAVGEVDHSNDAVNHRIADGDQGIRAANGETVNQLLEKVIEVRHYSAPKNLIRISLVESFSRLRPVDLHPLRVRFCQRTADDGFEIFRWAGFRITENRPNTFVKQSPRHAVGFIGSQ
ncbi:hypothetical protein EMIT0196P_90181 [Pseudomonas chlororaphis]